MFLKLDWILSFSEGSLKLCKLRCSEANAQVDLCVAIKHDFNWVLTYCDNIVDGSKCSALCKVPYVLWTVSIIVIFCYCTFLLVEKVKALLLDVIQPCCGNSDM